MVSQGDSLKLCIGKPDGILFTILDKETTICFAPKGAPSPIPLPLELLHDARIGDVDLLHPFVCGLGFVHVGMVQPR